MHNPDNPIKVRTTESRRRTRKLHEPDEGEYDNFLVASGDKESEKLM